MFKSLLKVRLRLLLDMYMNVGRKAGKKKSPVGMIILYAVLFLVFFGSMMSMAFGIGMATLLTGEEWVYFTALSVFGFFLSIFGSIMPAKSTLFEAKDNDMLLSMPVPPLYIMLSRMTALLASSLFYTGIVMIPGLIVYILFGILGMMNISALTIILYILTYITLSVLSLTLSSGVAYIIALIGSHIRNKSTVSVLLSVAFFVAFMYFYMDFITSMSTGDEEELGNNLAALFAGLAASPVSWLGRAVADGNVLYYLPLLAGTSLLAALLLYLLGRGTVRILTAPAATASKAVYKEKTEKRRSPVMALVSKELRGFFTNAAYVMNGITGVIMLIVLAILLFVNGGSVKEALTAIYNEFLTDPEITEVFGTSLTYADFTFRILTPAVTAILIMFSFYNVITASSISLEAKTLPIILSLPIRPYDFLLAKVLTQIIVTLPPSLLVAMIMTVYFELPFVSLLLIVLPVSAVSCSVAAFGLVINLLMPKFNWISVAAVCKQSGAVAVTLLSGMFLGFLLIFVNLIAAMFGFTVLTAVLETTVFGGIFAGFMAYLRKGGVRRVFRLSDIQG